MPGRSLAVGISSHSLILQKADNMDPNQTFFDMLAAIRDKDKATAHELALALKSWFANGGFYPFQCTPEAMNAYIASVLRRTAGLGEPEPPFSLTCLYCDAGQGIASEEEAIGEGWSEIEPAPQLLQANVLGVCPDCQERHATEQQQ